MKSVEVLAYLAAASLAASASADVVRFDNHDGAFPWGVTINESLPMGRPYLDVTQSSLQSGTTLIPQALTFDIRPFVTSSDWEERRFTGVVNVENNLDIAGGEPVMIDHWQGVWTVLTFVPPRVFGAGEFVGADETFVDRAVLEGSVYIVSMRQSFELVTSDDFYIGVRFTLAGQLHYGWVRIVRPPTTAQPMPYEWAYETTPGAAIRIPGGCAADWNQDGTVNSADFFDFLTVFLANDPAGDFNNDAIVNSADFFEFLTAFFVGC